MDLGGGTGENVALMSAYIDLARFKKIYVVDLCKSLVEQVRACTVLGGRTVGGGRRRRLRGACGPTPLTHSQLPPTPPHLPPQARQKVAASGWRNVEVVEADACAWCPPEGAATLATFSYSLSSAFCLAARTSCA